MSGQMKVGETTLFRSSLPATPSSGTESASGWRNASESGTRSLPIKRPGQEITQMQKATPIKLSRNEKKLIVDMGARWMQLSIDEILSENAIIFRLAVAIVGLKMKQPGAPERKT
jgi:hypothetical protein